MSSQTHSGRQMKTTGLNRRRLTMAAIIAAATVFAACKSDEVLNVSTPDFLGVDAYSTPAGVESSPFSAAANKAASGIVSSNA